MQSLGSIESIPGPAGELCLNPAVLGEIERSYYLLEHSRPFLLSDLAYSSFKGIWPVKPGAFRLGVGNFGIPGYRYYSCTLGYGMKIHDGLYAGIYFEYLSIQSSGEWNYSWKLRTGGGLLYRFDSKSSFAILIPQILRTGEKSSYTAPGTSSLSFSFNREIYPGSYFYTELSMLESKNLRAKCALEYIPGKKTALRIGYHSTPSTFSFGSGFKLGEFSLNYSFCWTAKSGLTPSFGICYRR